MLAASIALSLALYLMPLAIVAGIRARREKTLSELALDPPLFVAADLLLTLALSRIVTLDWAILTSRLLWFTGGVVVLARRWRAGHRPVRPALLSMPTVATGAFGALAGAALSFWYTRPWAGPDAAVRACMTADSRWHIPLVASLQGQKIPFHNIYQPDVLLSYHYTGDVLAAELRVLSMDVMHASLALALAHATMFGMMGLTIVLWLRAWGSRSAWFAVVGVCAVLLFGPAPILRPDTTTVAGYNFINFVRVSFRPHVPIAGVLIVGIVGSLLTILRDPAREPPWREKLGAPLAMVVLGITDEPSFVVAGIALGVVWVIRPLAGRTRWKSLAELLVIGLSPLLLNVLFPASLAGGGHHVSFTAPRSPGYHMPTVLLGAGRGWTYLLSDSAPVLLLTMAGLVNAVMRPSRSNVASAVFLGAIAVTSLLGLTALDVDGKAEESHRFWTAVMVAAPLCGLAWLHPGPSPALAGWIVKLFERWSIPEPGRILPGVLVLAAAGSVLPAMSTVQELIGVVPEKCPRTKELYAEESNLYEIDCARAFRSSPGGRAIPRYIEQRLFYRFAGCTPSFAPAPNAQYWTLAVRYPEFGQAALRQLDGTMLRPNQDLELVCDRGRSTDSICRDASTIGRCYQVGTAMLCRLPSDARRALLRSRRP